jgi:hypothetical protein
MHVVGCASEQYGVGNLVVIDEGVQPLRVFELVFFFKGDVYDLQTTRMVALVELDEEGRFVMAVRAPASADRNDDHLIAELGVRVAHCPAAEVRRGELEWLRCINDAGLFRFPGGRSEVFFAGFLGTARGPLLVVAQEVGDKQGAIGLRLQGEGCRPRRR